jgi:hypothetical protein
MAQRGRPARKSDNPTVYDVLNQYLAWLDAKREKSTLDRAQRHLKRLATRVGKRLKVTDLTKEHAFSWIDDDKDSRQPTRTMTSAA